jgi:hypothetical protein
MNAVYETATGRLVSVGTVVASPLPAGLTSVVLSPADAQGLLNGSRRWDAATRAVVATPGWIDPAIAEANGTTLRDRAANALTTNATYLAIGAPSNAQNLAQIRALTRQMNGSIRLELGRLDTITDA